MRGWPRSSHLVFLLWAALAPTRLAAGPEFGVVFVPGSFSNVDPMQVGQTFETQKDELNHDGIPWQELRIKSTDAYQASVPLFVNAIRSLPWASYMVVSHSMGGLIALDGLITNRSLQERLVGWIAYQSPFYGASILDRTAAAMDFFDPFRFRRLLSVSRCSGSCSVEQRAPYMRQNARAISALTAEHNIVCVSADAGNGNDLLVDTKSMTLPGAQEIRVNGVDHYGLAIGGRGGQTKRRIFVQALESFPPTAMSQCSQVRSTIGWSLTGGR